MSFEFVCWMLIWTFTIGWCVHVFMAIGRDLPLLYGITWAGWFWTIFYVWLYRGFPFDQAWGLANMLGTFLVFLFTPELWVIVFASAWAGNKLTGRDE